jgi:hypothetical protein
VNLKSRDDRANEEEMLCLRTFLNLFDSLLSPQIHLLGYTITKVSHTLPI